VCEVRWNDSVETTATTGPVPAPVWRKAVPPVGTGWRLRFPRDVLQPCAGRAAYSFTQNLRRDQGVTRTKKRLRFCTKRVT
jgi:hypothetical protein